MNPDVEDPTNEDSEAVVSAAGDQAADAASPKPARRKRVVNAASTPAAEADAVSARGDPIVEEPAIVDKPVRKRRAPKEAQITAVQEDGLAASPVEAHAAPVFVQAAVHAPAEGLGSLENAPVPSPVQEDRADDNGAGLQADSTAEQTSMRSERSRRRNRRDRHRDRDASVVITDEQRAAAGDENDDDDDQSAASPVPTLPPADVGEVFAQVVSGQFDVEGETAAENPEAHKRVLLPQPEAPKLHKVLAQAGIGSRRDMEQLIMDGKIFVNGQPAHIGQRISFGDHIKVDGKPVKVRIVPPPPRVIAYHKPVGEVVTHDDPQHRPTVFRRLPRLQQGKWQSVGRLDLNTEGLLLFTNSGELANQLMHPRFGVEREYAVRVLGTLDDETKDELLEGVTIDGQTASFKSIEDGGGEGANHWYRVVITEGRNREVRKLFEEVGLTVSRLIRIRYGTVVLPRGLKRGVWVDLSEDDVRTIRRLAGGEAQSRDERGGRGGRNKNRNRNDRGDRGDRGPRNSGRGNRPPEPVRADTSRERGERDFDADDDIDPARIPNPLEQTFDKRFVQNPRSGIGGRGFRSGGGGFGAGGSAPAAPKKGNGPREPDPLQTSVGYIGADAFHRKGGRGGRSGGGGGGGGGFGGGRRGR